MDEYDLPKRRNRRKDSVSLDYLIVSESDAEISEMTPTEQLFYRGMSRDNETGDEE